MSRTIWMALGLALLLGLLALRFFGPGDDQLPGLAPGDGPPRDEIEGPRRSAAIESSAATRDDEPADDVANAGRVAARLEGEETRRTETVARTQVRGKVVDQAGKPVAGAAVRIEILGPATWSQEARSGQLEVHEATRPAQLTTTTDERGGFDFKELARPSRVLVQVEDPGTTATASALIDSGMIKIIRIYVGSTIEGLVVDELGLPVVGLMVASRQVEAEETLDRNDLFNGEVWARSDASGRFRLSGVPPGPTRIECEAESKWLEGPTIEVENGGDHRVQVVARSTLAIAGRLHHSGMAAAEIDVMVVPESGTWREGFTGGVGRSDHEGRFQVEGLRPGKFTLVVQSRTRAASPGKKLERSATDEARRFEPLKLRGIDAGTTDLDIDLDSDD